MVTRSAANAGRARSATQKQHTNRASLRIGCIGPPRGNKKLVVFADEDGGAEDGGPEAALVADGGLRNVHGADDFVRDAVDLFFFVEAKIWVEFHVQRRREHFGCELFSVFAGDYAEEL